MTELLERQRKVLVQAFEAQKVNEELLLLDKLSRDEKSQFERDQRAMKDRLAAIGDELRKEPAAIRRSYSVVLRRFEPVGLAYLWPVS